MGHEELKAHEETHRGYTIEIYQDEVPGDPRKEWDNLGAMVAWHRRYDLGDEQPTMNATDWLIDLAQEATGEEYEGVIDGADIMAVVLEHYVILPLALLDHSGITMYVGAGAHLCDPGGWDSGQVGWIYMSLEKVREEYGDTEPETLARVRDYLENEVRVYDWYLTGNVYGYVVKDPGTGEWLDSCWGYYGHEGGGDASSWDDMIGAARSMIDWHVKQAREQHARRLTGWIRNRVPLGHREPAPAGAVGC